MNKRRVNLVLQDVRMNHNKFYQMTQVSDTEFQVAYGRIGNKPVNRVYPIGMWHQKYHEKLKKGYHDVSNYRITVGSVVKTDDHQLGIVTEICDYVDNEPYMVTVFMEHKPVMRIRIHDLSVGYINPDYFTHTIFYPKLVEKYNIINGTQL